MKWPNTQLAGCLFGVRTKSAIQIAIDAITLIGANQRMMLWRFLVVREHIVPKMIRTPIDSKTVCRAVLSIC